MKPHRMLLTLVLLLVPMSACGSTGVGGLMSGGVGGTTPSLTAHVWVTTTDRSKLLAPQADVVATATATGTVITVDPSQTYQTMTGFGAAMTDASAYLIEHRMSASQRAALMGELFGPAPGLNLSFMRLAIGASDFSQVDYSYDDMPAGATDPTLAHFSIAPAKADVIPAVRQALALNPRLTVMASPWSAPGWMKTSDSLIQGSLKPEAYPYFAAYLSRYVRDMKAEGVPVSMITLQNEPGFEPRDYPGMRVEPASRAAFIGGHLGPRFATDGVAAQILDYDHNWDLPSSPLTVLGDAMANPYVAGVAWHCYGGDVAAQGPVHDAYPTKDAYFTECSGGEWAPDFGDSLDWFVRNLVIGSTRNWSKGVLLWNLALDENHGPHLGGCTDCRGVVTINSATGEVTRNLEYYALGHASRFVRAGAKRIASDSDVRGLSTVAFRNSDDGSVVVIVLNTNATAASFSLASGGANVPYSLPAGAVATFVWQP